MIPILFSAECLHFLIRNYFLRKNFAVATAVGYTGDLDNGWQSFFLSKPYKLLRDSSEIGFLFFILGTKSRKSKWKGSHEPGNLDLSLLPL